MSDNKNISISFGLNSFEILSYSFEKPPKDFNKKSVGYQLQFRPHVDIKKSTFTIELEVKAQLGKDTKHPLGVVQTMTIYRLSEIENLLDAEGKLTLPKNLAITLLSVAISTTRGAMAAKSEGNLLSEFVLPLINPEEIFESSPLKGPIELEEKGEVSKQ